MLMVPKVDKVGQPHVTEYHHMDLLEFAYYHADPTCPFKDVMCKSNACSPNKVAAFFEHLHIQPTSNEKVTRSSIMITKIRSALRSITVNVTILFPREVLKP